VRRCLPHRHEPARRASGDHCDLDHYCWTIEIVFWFFKQILGCRHLLSRSQNGIEIQTYCAIIACMRISLWSRKKLALRTYEMVCWYFVGMASMYELVAHLERLKKPTE